MDFLIEWITNIILFVLLATVIDMLLPNSNLQKYTKMVTGLLLMAIILSPILKIVSQDFQIPTFEFIQDKNAENLIEIKKKEIQASQTAYILEQTAVQMKNDAQEELMTGYGLMITDIDLSVNDQAQGNFPENVEKIKVQLTSIEEKTNTVEAISKVEINTDESPPTNDQSDTLERITSHLSEKWGVGQEMIDVMVKGGSTS
ncbi:stage III sporulation protein AF [Bacillus massilinigeriensis]|uniref:stage III sporulation protein AF n=1 Tax=Bacillus massilionigeriensis TaxID=1805475 RepID=UPI00096B103C|nr:stage III sporulation protein AF [Bacillus massilionigeriensis]